VVRALNLDIRTPEHVVETMIVIPITSPLMKLFPGSYVKLKMIRKNMSWLPTLRKAR